MAVMQVTVRDSSSLASINNAWFDGSTVTYTNTGGGGYQVTCDPNRYVNCDAPGYAGQTFNSGPVQSGGELRPRTIGLVDDVWP